MSVALQNTPGRGQPMLRRCRVLVIMLVLVGIQW